MKKRKKKEKTKTTTKKKKRKYVLSLPILKGINCKKHHSLGQQVLKRKKERIFLFKT